MKKESEKLLNEIYVYSDDLNVKKKVLQILRIEQSQAKGKFDYYKFVSKDPIRPILCGVYHDNGIKVASNSFILVAIKDEYDRGELDGKVVGKDGAFIEDKYPNWRAVIPDLTIGKKRSEVIKINFTKWDEIMATWKAEKKVGEEKRVVRVGNAYYKVELFNLLVLALKKLGTDEFVNTWIIGCLKNGVEDMPTAGFAQTSDGSIALLMPYKAHDAECYVL